jgi:hypothetical protein
MGSAGRDEPVAPLHRPPPRGWRAYPACPLLRDREFADSLLEGTGFEPSVPRQEKWRTRRARISSARSVLT